MLSLQALFISKTALRGGVIAIHISSGNRGLKEANALQKCTQRVHGVEGFEPGLDATAQTQPPGSSEEGPI